MANIYATTFYLKFLLLILSFIKDLYTAPSSRNEYAYFKRDYTDFVNSFNSNQDIETLQYETLLFPSIPVAFTIKQVVKNLPLTLREDKKTYTINYMLKSYVGFAEGRTSFFYGHVINGIFEAFVFIENEMYVIESCEKSSEDSGHYNHIVYKGNNNSKHSPQVLPEKQYFFNFHLVADHSVFSANGDNIDRTVAKMDRLLRAVSSFYAKQNVFNDPREILTFTGDYEIYMSPGPFNPATIPTLNGTQILRKFGIENFSQYDLAILFTSLELGGLLGESIRGAICSHDHITYNGKLIYQNVLFVNLKDEEFKPFYSHTLTLAHEIGHSLGLTHDSSTSVMSPQTFPGVLFEFSSQNKSYLKKTLKNRSCLKSNSKLYEGGHIFWNALSYGEFFNFDKKTNVNAISPGRAKVEVRVIPPVKREITGQIIVEAEPPVAGSVGTTSSTEKSSNRATTPSENVMPKISPEIEFTTKEPATSSGSAIVHPKVRASMEPLTIDKTSTSSKDRVQNTPLLNINTDITTSEVFSNLNAKAKPFSAICPRTLITIATIILAVNLHYSA
ncbi:uncharacterized protein LOC135144418 [Zophobas morio]|uniref:uncharacterized protein LOC135144418 n=1 Tax=Zophobas morio TaxID=2755281 RepID=UPI003082E09D